MATDPWARPRMRRSRSDPGARSGASLLKWLAALGRVRASLDVSAAPLKNWFATLGRRLFARSLLRQRTLGHRSCRHFARSPLRQRTLRHRSYLFDPLRPADYKSCTRQPRQRAFHAGWRGGHRPLRRCAACALGHRRATARTRYPALPMLWRCAAWRGHEKVPAAPLLYTAQVALRERLAMSREREGCCPLPGRHRHCADFLCCRCADWQPPRRHRSQGGKFALAPALCSTPRGSSAAASPPPADAAPPPLPGPTAATSPRALRGLLDLFAKRRREDRNFRAACASAAACDNKCQDRTQAASIEPSLRGAGGPDPSGFEKAVRYELAPWWAAPTLDPTRYLRTHPDARRRRQSNERPS